MIKLVTVADIVSLSNALFGFLAMLMIFSNETRFAYSFILLALLADGLDGVIARKTRKGDLGEYMEAMADMISLGIAPVFFVYHIYESQLVGTGFIHGVFVGVLLVFLSCSIIRLASFHIIKAEAYFVGLPASAATMFLIIFSLFSVDLYLLLILIVIVGIVLVSSVRFPKLSLRMNMVAAILILLTIVVGEQYFSFAPLMLCISLVLYSVAGPVYLSFYKKNF